MAQFNGGTSVPFDHYKISVFDPSGMLIQFEEHSLLLRIGLNMSAMGPTLAINDPLTRSAQGLGSELQDRASKVRTRSTNRSMIGAENDTAFEIHRTTMRALTHRLVPPIRQRPLVSTRHFRGSRRHRSLQ